MSGIIQSEMDISSFWPNSVERKLQNGNDLNYLLQENALLVAYLQRSEVATTNLMLGNPRHKKWEDCQYDPDQTRFESSSLRGQHDLIARIQRNQLKAGGLVTEHTIYTPVTPAYIKNLIEMDEVFRLSKSYNRTQIDVFRGTVHVKDTDLRMLNSWSTSQDVANGFKTNSGSMLQARLPAGFPYIDVSKAHCNVCYKENEILLPPCEVEVTSKNTKSPLTAKLRPLNFAKVFLDRLNNLPDDYPIYYKTHPLYDFAKAKQMLEDYVTNYVDKGLIQVGDMLIEEKPDPVVEFDFDDTFGQE